MKELKTVLISDGIDTLLEALNEKHPSLGSGQAVVCNEDGNLVGVITDSDFRRFILSNDRLPTKIDEILNRNPIAIELGDSSDLQGRELASILTSRGWETNFPINFVVVTKNNKPIRLQSISDFSTNIEKIRDTIVIFGLGFVGLTLGIFFAESGLNVVGIDSDKKKIDSLRRKKVYLYEPGLEEALTKVLDVNFFVFENKNDYVQTIQNQKGARNIFFITVGTYLGENNEVDFTGLDQVSNEIAAMIKANDLIALRSTLSIGTTENRVREILESKSGLVAGVDFSLTYAPERTIEGNALKELKELPQIIGGITLNCRSKIKRIFESAGVKVVEVSSCKAAELIKLTSNAYRDVNFAFANEIARISIENHLSPDEIIESANYSYSRNLIAKPSPGVGGPCLWKDSLILAEGTKDPEFLIAARKVNIKVIYDWLDFIIQQVQSTHILKGNLNVLILGVTFKGVPETNDTRNSSSVIIMKELKKLKYDVEYWDYILNEVVNTDYSIEKSLEDFRKYSKQKNYHVVIIANNHPQNRIKFLEIAKEIPSKEKIVLADPWKLLTSEDRISLGNKIIYFGMGLPDNYE